MQNSIEADANEWNEDETETPKLFGADAQEDSLACFRH